jgi:iron complex outermembrane recepter protein
MYSFRYLLLFSLISLCLAPPVAAQTVPVQLHIYDARKDALSFAAVHVISIPDSSIKLADMTDSLGNVTFRLDTTLSYHVKVQAAGFEPLDRVIGAGRRDTLLLQLRASGKSLNEVVVRSARNMVTQEDDKTIVDAEHLAEASSNGYELLEKTPGLFVDQDGNIYLNSTTPATIYINGRELKMSRNDVATMLKSLPPTAILRIEILRTPSAKYDASGSGGIVNVVLKKGVRIGLTGSANAGFQQGTRGNRFAGLNLSHNDGGTAAYFNLNYSNQDNYTKLGTDRLLGPDTLLSQQAYTTYPGHVLFLGYGINRDLNDQWNMGYDGRLSLNQGTNKTDNTNVLRTVLSGEEIGQSLTVLNNRNRSLLLDQNFSARYKIDTSGSEWTNTLSYTYAAAGSEQVYQTTSLLPAFGGDGTVNSRRHYLAAQSDITRKLRFKINLEAGLKSTLLFFRNDAAYFVSNTGGRSEDGSRTTLYRYRENINAAYIQGSKTIGTFILKTGLRLENTNMDGEQLRPGDTSFTIRRTDLFPYVYLSKKIMAIAGFDIRAYLVYRRTISRPSYEQLNPFPRYVDQFMSEIGNPGLRPQFTNNYEFNISAAEHPLIAFGFNDTKDMFTNVFYQADSTRAQAYRGYDNIGSNKEFYVRGFAAIPPGRGYFGLVGGQYNRNIYKGLYEGAPLDFKGENWLFFTYHQLRLGKNSTFTMNGFWRLAGPLQFYELSEMGSLSMSLNRKFFKQKLTIAINATDIFYTNNNTFTVRQGSVNASGSRATDSRRFGLNLRYEFGLRKKEEQPGMFDAQPQQ